MKMHTKRQKIVGTTILLDIKTLLIQKLKQTCSKILLTIKEFMPTRVMQMPMERTLSTLARIRELILSITTYASELKKFTKEEYDKINLIKTKMLALMCKLPNSTKWLIHFKDKAPVK